MKKDRAQERFMKKTAPIPTSSLPKLFTVILKHRVKVDRPRAEAHLNYEWVMKSHVESYMGACHCCRSSYYNQDAVATCTSCQKLVHARCLSGAWPFVFDGASYMTLPELQVASERLRATFEKYPDHCNRCFVAEALLDSEL